MGKSTTTVCGLLVECENEILCGFGFLLGTKI